MNIEEGNGATVLRRKADEKPPRNWRSRFIGRPLPTADASHQTIGRLIGLAVFASDALSSTAYATQEMLVILAMAGTAAAFGYSVPIAIAIIILLAVLTLSYEQIIHAYPDGGGAYVVARDNLGKIPSLIAAASLLTDYILTVAVSVSSGVAQIVSAAPDLFPWRVWIAIGLIGLVMLINLRGVKESGSAFAIPSYFFVVMMYLTVGVGIVRMLSGGLGDVVAPPELEMYHGTQELGLFLILRAFASGTSAVTGVEAISNGTTAFKEPRSKNAGQTLIWMSLILGSLMLGITFLAHEINAVPSETETIISQLARTVYDGRGLLYFGTIIGTMIILVMAANTAFAGFPRLGAIVGIDGFLPRQMAYRGSRLVYSRGIVALALLASLLIVLFQASVTSLIPLYAIGVFLSFTLSQAGMSIRWRKSGKILPGEEIKEQGSSLRYEKGWFVKMVVNGMGAALTAVVAVIFAVTKFADGAWIVILVIPALVILFLRINKHYGNVAHKLTLEKFGSPPHISRHRVILTLGGVHRGSLAALRYAKNLSEDVTAVHVSIDPEEAEKLQKKWDVWGEGVRLVVLDSPYRLFIEPLLEYIEDIDERRQANEVVTIVVPQFISHHPWSSGLHANTAETLRKVLLDREGIVITEVPYQVD